MVLFLKQDKQKARNIIKPKKTKQKTKKKQKPGRYDVQGTFCVLFLCYYPLILSVCRETCTYVSVYVTLKVCLF